MLEVRTGDEVFGADGRPCRVVAKSEIWRDRPVFAVATDDGDRIVADAEHEWQARLDWKGPFRVHTTERLARPRRQRAMIERQGALELPDVELPVDPWVLGYWLGNGNSGTATVTTGGPIGEPAADEGWIREELGRVGVQASPPRAVKHTIGLLGVQVKLRSLSLLGNKHIPAAYMRASRDQRLALLQGLIDSDGHVHPDGQVEFCSTVEQLAVQVRELVHSLGRKCSLIVGRAKLNGHDCGPSWRAMFYMANAARLPRKARLCRDVEKTPHRYVSAEPRGRADTVCIQVDSPDHMFLAGRSMLPTHNSELISRTFPAWWLGTFPDSPVLLASYEADFAAHWGGKARDLTEEHGHELFGIGVRKDRRAANWWHLEGRGGYMATAGVGGPITGKGAKLLIVDDPIKNADEAHSKTIRDKQWDWWQTTAYTRLEPDGAAVIGMARWHEDDLVGRLLREMSVGGERWEVLRLPAVAEEPGPGGELDPLERKPGEALWPERYDETALERIRRATGTYAFSALYQQSPNPAGGGVFKREWFRYYQPATGGQIRLLDPGASDRPAQMLHVASLRRFAIADLAVSTKTSSDYTAIGVFGADPGTRALVLLDLVRARMEGPDIIPALQRVHRKWSLIFIGIETVAFQLMIVQAARRAGLPVREILADKDKVSRALAATPAFEAGRVWFPRMAPWLDAYESELLAFPSGEHDDQADVTGYGVATQDLVLPRDVEDLLPSPTGAGGAQGRGAASGAGDPDGDEPSGRWSGFEPRNRASLR